MSDKRFASAKTDPRFRKPKSKQLKVELDDRFKDVLERSDFAEGSGGGRKAKGRRLDKYGRPLAASHEADQLKRFYRLKSPSPSRGGEQSKSTFIDFARGEGALPSSGSEVESDEESDVEQEELEIGPSQSKRFLPEVSGSDSDSDELQVNLDEDEDDEESSAFPPEDVGRHSESAEHLEDEEAEDVAPTSRVAAVNMDWDNLKAGDLFSIFNSFLQPTSKDPQPPPGRLLHVKVYPSEFGRERMAQEEIEGPGGSTFARHERQDGNRGDPERSTRSDAPFSSPEEPSEEFQRDVDGESDRDDAEVDMDQLRQYQLERLRYYYAVATFSNASAAARVLSECNGTEFEHTANIMDLSYVPDEMDFDGDEVRDEATEEPKAYKGTDFVTDALRHSKVKLTWDQDDPNREKLTRRTLTRQEIEEEDFKTYLASSDSEDTESDDGVGPSATRKPPATRESAKERTARLRALLLGGGDENANDVWGKAGRQSKLAESTVSSRSNDGIDITFKPGLTAGPAPADEEDLTTLQKYQRRMKEKLQRKKEKRELRQGADKSTAAAGNSSTVAADDFFGADNSESDLVPTAKPDLASNLSAPQNVALVDGTRHFSMTDVVREERQAGKKRKRGKHSKKREGEEARERELGDSQWQIDVKDERFRALHEEADFAIDPSNPKYQKTKAMERMLAERAARRAKSLPDADAGTVQPKWNAKKIGEDKDLSTLVKQVKRRHGG